jgi:hypothetical protein
MKLLALPVALAIAANASGEILYRVSDSFWVWNGGSAYRSGNLWVGGGGDTLSSASSPWNHVTPAPPLVPRARRYMHRRRAPFAAVPFLPSDGPAQLRRDAIDHPESRRHRIT